MASGPTPIKPASAGCRRIGRPQAGKPRGGRELKPFWHPLSTLLLVDPPCYATAGLLRMLLRLGPVKLRYAGDRMWPAVQHGEELVARPRAAGAFEPGSAVIVLAAGIPELLRVVDAADEHLRLAADADPAAPLEVPTSELVALTSIENKRRSPRAAVRHRRWLDAREAWTAAPDEHEDPGATVLDKYEAQAPFYAGNPLAGLAPSLLARLERHVAPGARVLVVGSGAGFESFDLAARGYRVTGLDFSQAMISSSRDEARRRALDVTFRLGDVRDPALELGRFDAMLFTYDVYSFIPGRASRVAALRRLARALEPRGAMLLSARIVRSGYERYVLTLQRLHGRRAEWGDSHTRWIDTTGRLRRSFVRLFSPRELVGEIRAAGLELEQWEEGHGVLLHRGPSTLL